MGSSQEGITRAAKAMHARMHADCADQPCPYTPEDAEELEGLARIAIGVFEEEQKPRYGA